MSNSKPDFLDPSRIWIGIIGMGAGGAALFNNIVQRMAIHPLLQQSIGIALVDSRPREEFGRGVAWASLQSELFLANMRLPTMGLRPKVVGQLEAISEHGTFDPDKAPERSQFEVRTKIGAALHEEFEEHVVQAENLQIPVVFHHDKVDDLDVFGRGFSIRFENRQAVFVDFCVLALGNVPKNSLTEFDGVQGFIANPWKWEEYGKSLKGKRVGIAGLGPSAVDTILLANDEGARKIYAASRTSGFQYPRPKNRLEQPHELQFLSRRNVQNHFDIMQSLHKAGIEFAALEALVVAELGEHCHELLDIRKLVRDAPARDMLCRGQEAANKYPAWYAILKAIDENIPFIWHCLTNDAKSKYKEKWERDHNLISYGMAYRQCERLIRLIDDHKLEAGKATDQPRTLTEGGFMLAIDGNEVEVDVLINCTGIGGDPNDFKSPLVKNLIRKKWLIKHEWGGFHVNFNHGQLTKGASEVPSVGDVYALAGSLTRGTHLLTNCLGALFASCERTAQHVLQKISAAIPSPDGNEGASI